MIFVTAVGIVYELLHQARTDIKWSPMTETYCMLWDTDHVNRERVYFTPLSHSAPLEHKPRCALLHILCAVGRLSTTYYWIHRFYCSCTTNRDLVVFFLITCWQKKKSLLRFRCVLNQEHSHLTFSFNLTLDSTAQVYYTVLFEI